MKSIWELVRDAYFGWNDDKAWRLGAALSYFAVFSLAPFFLIALVITSLIFGQAAAAGRIIAEIQGLTGEQLALAIRATTANAYLSKSTIAATIFGAMMLILGATGVFIQLREALNSIWYVEPKPLGTIKDFIQARLISFAMLLGIIFLFLLSPILSATMAAFGKNLSDLLPGVGKSLEVADFVISTIVFTGLFALIFKLLPDAEIEWRDVWIGAAVTQFYFPSARL
jgi:membrane protein